MSVTVNHVRNGFYLDSVALMRLSAAIGGEPGVDDAVLMIGTEANRQIMADADLLSADGEAAGANDLVIAVRARDEDTASAAIAAAIAGLEGNTTAGNTVRRQARSLAGALEQLPDANLVLVSTPGEFAAREARHALARNLNVMIFSDNVSLDDELALKREARERGLLVMGPDCGTAYIAGTPLAFANVVEHGTIGVIAASGTGLQEFAVLVSRMGHGIHHGIGVGGRDLSDQVGGLSTLTAIDLLASDPTVDRIAFIAKPPGRSTAREVLERLARCGKPVTACVLGPELATVAPGIALAPTLADAAALCCRAPLPPSRANDDALVSAIASTLAPGRNAIQGLYSGGTLCGEARQVLEDEGLAADGANRVLDLGADEYTVGRPHPMIEPAVRTPHLRSALGRDDLAVILIDVVLGHGAHQDPAAAVADTVAGASVNGPAVIASVCGTERDPQVRSAQVRRLESAGVTVCTCNADAARLAARVARRARG